jgi:phosphatidylglycerol---prolipoprotein diacylglyceryl transferase
MQIEQNLWNISLFGEVVFLSPFTLFNGVGFILGIFLLDHYLTKNLPEKRNCIYTLFIFCIAIGWFGAHILDWIVRDISFPQAGFTYLGGLFFASMIFVPVATIFLTPDELWRAINCAIVPLVAGHAIGRLGCFFGGCCFGRPLQTDSPIAHFFSRHPTQLYEAGYLTLLSIFLIYFQKKSPANGVTTYLFFYGIFRFCIEFLRADDRGFFFIFSTSQWLSLLLIILAGSILSYIKLHNKPFVQSNISYRKNSKKKNEIFF